MGAIPLVDPEMVTLKHSAFLAGLLMDGVDLGESTHSGSHDHAVFSMQATDGPTGQVPLVKPSANNMLVSWYDVQDLQQVLWAKAEGIRPQTRPDLPKRTGKTSIWSGEDDEEMTLPDAEVPLVYSLHYAEQGRQDWEDELPPETMGRIKKQERGKSNLHCEENFGEKLERLNLDPRLSELIHKYQEVFGALPPHLSCKKMVKIDPKLQADAILTDHHCDQQGPRVATHTDIHRHPAGEVDTLRLVGATVTIVYITPTQMRIMAQCDAHHAPFLSDPQWPARLVFQAYLRACATKAGCDIPGPKDIDTAYKAFQRQQPRPRPSEHETPHDGRTTQEEPDPSAEGWTPAIIILLLAPNGHKHATRTVQRHHAPWSIPKHNAPETDVPPVRHSDQGIPRTCWHCGPAALDTPWPLLHLISTHYHTPTAAANADQQAWPSPWFHTVPQDHPAHVAWTQTPTATWTFTNERADPDSVAREYDCCDPHRAGTQEAPMRPL